MHDLRRRALEGNKTLSRKARSRISSQTTSGANSRSNSATPSRQASRAVSRSGSADSDDEAGDGGMFSSTGSIDAALASVENGPEDIQDSLWSNVLKDRIEEIIDWKRSSIQGREAALNAYVQLLTRRFCHHEIDGQESHLVASFLRSVKVEESEKEMIFALKALVLTLITSQQESIYGTAESRVRGTIMHYDSSDVKTEAIYTLSMLTFYGNLSDREVMDNMNFFLEIVSTDGSSINAPDSAEAVTAALESFALLATQLDDDLSAEFPDIGEPLGDQLESSSAAVQVAAAETIALLYEKSWTPPEDDEESMSSSDDDNQSSNKKGPALIQRYTAITNVTQLLHMLDGIASGSNRHVAKKEKKDLRQTAADVANTLRNPRYGPGAKFEGANKQRVKIAKNKAIRIDKWWKLVRLEGLKRALQGGFLVHYELNDCVGESLAMVVEDLGGYKGKRK